MKKLHVKHMWLILASYGVWFAIFSGLEEISIGKYLKAVSALILGIVTYLIFEQRDKK